MLEPLATPGADSGAKPVAGDELGCQHGLHPLGDQPPHGCPVPGRHPVQRPGRRRQPSQADLEEPLLHRSPFASSVGKGVDSTERHDRWRSISISLGRPSLRAHTWTATPSTCMMAPADAQGFGTVGSNHPIGTGPFVFSYVASPTTRSRSTATPTTGVASTPSGNVRPRHARSWTRSSFEVITDDGTHAADAFQTGDVNMLSTISAQTANSLASNFHRGQGLGRRVGVRAVEHLAHGERQDRTRSPTSTPAKPSPTPPTPGSVADIEGKGLVLATSPFGPNTPWGMPSEPERLREPRPRASQRLEVAEFDAGDRVHPSLTFTLMGLSNHRRRSGRSSNC